MTRSRSNAGRRSSARASTSAQLLNSLIIAGTSTLLSVVLGVLAAYAFSRFNIPGKDDLLFFILSTRMLPPVVVTIPIFLMYRQLGLYDTHLGHDPALHRFQSVVLGLAAQGLHRRNPEANTRRPRWSMAIAACRRSARSCCRRR